MRSQLGKILQNLNNRRRCHLELMMKQYSTKSPALTRHFDEITIPVPWGHIAGKWYGPRHIRPLIGLHGWQDNAGTFDTLAPLLPQHLPFLSLDMPGHGLSSWLPEGIAYHTIDYVVILLRLMDEFKWDKLSIMAHSMSSMNSFTFAALFPNKVDMIIALDILKPLNRSPEKALDFVRKRLEKFLQIEKRSLNNTEPPSYEWEQLVERLHLGTEKSIDINKCKYLLQRNTKPSQHSPHKYYFSRDNRLKASMYYPFAHEIVLEMATRIQCPHLFIKALQAPYYENKKYFDETLAVLKKNPNFEFYEIEGSHHVHLNEPEKVAFIVNPFINAIRSERC